MRAEVSGAEKDGEAWGLGWPGLPCWVAQCLIRPLLSTASQPKEAGRSALSPGRPGSRSTSRTWSRTPEWPGSRKEGVTSLGRSGSRHRSQAVTLGLICSVGHTPSPAMLWGPA